MQACSKYQVCVIYYDIEYSDYQGSLSNDMYYKIAKAFCDVIEGAGYYGLNNGYNNWDNKIQYNPFGNVLLHQFTSNAKKGVLKDIKGIDSKFLDCSYDHGLISTFNKVKNKASNLNVGDSVRVKAGSKWYDGQSIANFVFKNQYEVIQIKGDRVVIGVNGKVTGAISLDSLY